MLTLQWSGQQKRFVARCTPLNASLSRPERSLSFKLWGILLGTSDCWGPEVKSEIE